MDAQPVADPFLDQIPVFSDFGMSADAANYRPLPGNWVLGVADIVGSTKAIAAGRYKSVNMAGASVISALINAIDRQDLPFVFGGDGALVAFPESAVGLARAALSAVQVWVQEELDLTMRGALVPMADVRAAGFDVRVARFKVSDHVSYAMFTGGGSSWAEAEMKAGRFQVTPAPAGTRPDLTGLSCRWNPIEARHGAIVSIVALPRGAPTPAFRQLVSDVVKLTGSDRGGHPLPAEGPGLAWRPQGLDIEARAAAPKGHRLRPKLAALAQIALMNALHYTGISLGGFNTARYRREVSENSDFRKFDDGLKMTVDVDAETLGRIEARLKEAEQAGVCTYGLHSQDSALITCIVMSPMQPNHVHFVDGAAGGYAMAAAGLKAKLAD